MEDNMPPMVKIWSIVIVSMFVTGIAGYVWNERSINILTEGYSDEVGLMNEDIEKLTIYRNMLKASSTIQGGDQ